MDYEELISDFRNVVDQVNYVFNESCKEFFFERPDLVAFLNQQKDLIEKLSLHGWVYSPFSPADMPSEWVESFSKGNTDTIVSSFFVDSDSKILKETITETKAMMKNVVIDWFDEAVYLYENSRFTSCAMLLYVIIENTIFELANTSITFRSSTKPKLMSIEISKIIASKLLDSRKAGDESSLQIVYPIWHLPSLVSFVSMNFGNAGDFLSSPEPLHLNRHWLLHGKVTRKVTSVDCLKLFLGLHLLITTKSDFINWAS